VECESKNDTGNNRGDWKHRKMIQTVPEQHSEEVRNQGITETSIIEHCTQTEESANVKAHKIFHGGNNIICSTLCKYRTAATL